MTTTANLGFAAIAALTLVAAGVAMALRDLIHSALLLIAAWAGIAAFYLWAGAEFAAFAQVLVYVGAVSMVVLFAVLLTRRGRIDSGPSARSIRRGVIAGFVGAALFGLLAGVVTGTDLPVVTGERSALSVRELGRVLMTAHPASLLVIGVILTVALLGAVLIAATDRSDEGNDR